MSQPSASSPPRPTAATVTSDGGAFPSTQWSLVIRAGESPASSTQARRALESLCRRYWYPLYGFVRRQGRAHHEAEDCTQAFFAHLLATEGLRHATPGRGRFRTFLLSSLRHHLTSDWRRVHAQKRGGDVPHDSLDFSTAEERFRREPVDPQLTPERAFDRSWALTMIDEAVDALRADYAQSGRNHVFAALTPLIWSADRPDSVVQQAAAAGLSVNAFTVALHRARRRLGERLRAAVAETVADPADVDAELRDLLGSLGTPSGAA